jgi:hypothetical protein
MVAGAGTAIVWTILKMPLGIHAFIAGTVVALGVILISTVFSPGRDSYA